MADAIVHDGIEFRTLDEHPGYAVSACGKVASRWGRGCRDAMRGWRLLRLRSTKDGYKVVVLCNGGVRRDRRVHRLVLETWRVPCLDGQECRHLNGDRADNRVENLAWGTASENQQDRRRHGTDPRGSRCGMAKLTEADIPAIRQLLDEGISQTAIARQFGVGQVTISYIGSGRTWTHV